MTISRKGSILMIATSLTITVAVSVAMDALLLASGTSPVGSEFVGALLVNMTTLLQAGVGSVIEWRRPGHAIGRLLLLTGPMYALLAAGWSTSASLEGLIDATLFLIIDRAGSLLVWPGVALIAGWLPLLFPTGSLPSPRWRLPALGIAAIGTAGVIALAFKPGDMGWGNPNPLGIPGWPSALQPLADAVPVALLAQIGLAGAGLVTRYRRGDAIERLQVRWLGAAVAVAVVGFAGAFVGSAFGWERDALVAFGLLAYAGILLMPISIGIAVLRYRLYEIDRIISRTVGWSIVTGILVAIFAFALVGLQALLSGITQGGTLAVAVSTLAAFGLLQPVRHHVQDLVDRRFDRRRYDAERTVGSFADRAREEVDLDRLSAILRHTAEQAVKPVVTSVWLRTGRRA
jgi:hypothetical protein